MIKMFYGFDLDISDTYKNKQSVIVLSLIIPDTTVFDKEAYNLQVSENRIFILAAGTNGIFYGIQTLLQMLPLNKNQEISIPSISITDAPKFKWRGMHLDVCRHFFPKEFVKKYIDYLAMYKMNTFHWHLTDDQGWRIEIKKYPKLTEIGAWRNGSMLGHYTEERFDSLKYGGFYTQEDIKELIAYAAERHITVVPEIELPGHAQAAIAAYPQLSCTGNSIEVAKGWGVFDDVFCPKDETFTFLEDVLSEVIVLFPSEYIHIGGDECPKTRWKECKSCQSVIKKNGLKDEDGLQSYFIRRIEKFVNSKGRKIIGWDEILEGGLAPNAAVMSWRGIEGGISAAKQKHYVVMTPGSHCYFDHYQGEPKNEPLGIGGFTPVEKVYAYQPIPKELSASESKYILGAQGNLWTEYINDPQHVEYMALPRMAALAEVVWGTSDPKNYKNFEKRLIKHFDLLDKMGVNYSKSIFEVKTKAIIPKNGEGILLSLTSSFDSSNLHYAFNNELLSSQSSTYVFPIKISSTTKLKAAYFMNGIQKSATIVQDIYISKSTGKKITLKYPPSDKYSTGGASSLVNGIMGDSIRHKTDWLGFRVNNLEAIIDLKSVNNISSLKINTLKNEGNWVHYAKGIEVYVSEEGIKFTRVGGLNYSQINGCRGKVEIPFENQKARYVKVIAINGGKIATGYRGAGSDSWLFIDEILVD